MKHIGPPILALLFFLQEVRRGSGYHGRNFETKEVHKFGSSESVMQCVDLWKQKEAVIKSPKFGEGNYQNNLHVTYHVLAPPGSAIILRCPQFRLQLRNPWTGKCSDYLEVPMSSPNEEKSRMHYCGLDIPYHSFVFNQSLSESLVFASDEAGTEIGFLCLLQRMEKQEGSTVHLNLMTSIDAEIQSGEVTSDPRTQHQGTLFSLVAPENSVALLSCSVFRIPDNWKCMQEYLLINGKRYCGSKVPRDILLFLNGDSNSVYFLDDVDTPSRFRCSVTRLRGEDVCSSPSGKMSPRPLSPPPPEYPLPDAVHCVDLIVPETAVVQTEDFGFHNYSTDLKMDNFVMAPLASTITMKCHNFSLELSHWCRKDFLAVHSELWPMVRYCGEKYKGRQSIEERNTISFVSDGNVTAKGFRCVLQKHVGQVDHHVNLMSTRESWISFSARSDPSKWLNARTQEVYVVTAPEDSMLNITCPIFNVGCRFFEDLHVGTRLYGESLCDATSSAAKSVVVPYNLANNTIVFTDDMRTASNFHCLLSRTGGIPEPCAFPSDDETTP